MAQSVENAGVNARIMDTLSDYNAVVAAVSRATGIPEALVFSRKKGQIYYDARWIAVQLLDDMGYYPAQIADLAGMTPRNVTMILGNIRARKPEMWKQFGSELEACRKALGITTTA